MNKAKLLILCLACLVDNPKEERERTWWELGIDKKEEKRKKKIKKRE